MSELLQENAPDAASLRGQLKTFSAVFDGDPIDERDYIEVAVESTGADTTYTNPKSAEFIDELREFIWHQEEPFVSTGPYAQWCVMRSAREQVTVLLDGQGGDELLAGYVPYQLVYLRQLRKEGRYAELRHETAKSRDVLMPLVRRRLSQRRKRLDTRQLLKPGFVGRVTDPQGRRLADAAQGASAAGPADLLPALPAPLRGPQLHGVQRRVAAAVSRPGVRRLPAHVARRRHHPRRLEPLDPARRPQGHSSREDPPEALEGRVHDAGDALDQGAPGGLHEPLSVADVPVAAVLGRHGARRRVSRLLSRQGRGVAALLAHRQRRALAARVLRPQRGARGCRHRGGPHGAGRDRAQAPRHDGRGRRPARAGVAGRRRGRGRQGGHGRGAASPRRVRPPPRQAPLRGHAGLRLRAPAHQDQCGLARRRPRRGVP